MPKHKTIVAIKHVKAVRLNINYPKMVLSLLKNRLGVAFHQPKNLEEVELDHSSRLIAYGYKVVESQPNFDLMTRHLISANSCAPENIKEGR